MPLTIIMYHYVRDLERTRYPSIKGRTVAQFEGQLDYIGHHHSVVTAEEVVAAAKGEASLPEDAAWLTFDDGYIDHYTNVFPLLHDRGWQGSFFPPARTVLEHELLDVNKIHFILAAQPDTAKIIAEIRSFIEPRRDGETVHSFDRYWSELAQEDRFDSREIVFIKRILQHALPEALRGEIAQHLFERCVSVDPRAFASELYMSVDQVRMMVRCGMYVGSHGAKHYWLDRLDRNQQRDEIDASLDFLRLLGAPTTDWVMCYPYGAYNKELLSLLAARRCAVALTTKVAVADFAVDTPLELPRLDTNDLPTAQ